MMHLLNKIFLSRTKKSSVQKNIEFFSGLDLKKAIKVDSVTLSCLLGPIKNHTKMIQFCFRAMVEKRGKNPSPEYK